MATIFKRIFCNHDWEEIKSIRVFENTSDSMPYKYIYIYKCKNCGKFKKLTT